MIRIQLRAERAERIDINLVIDVGSVRGIVDLPSTGVDLRQRKRMGRRICRANPVDELGEVTDLVKSVPDRELKFTICSAWRKADPDFDEMLLGSGKSNGVSSRLRRLSRHCGCEAHPKESGSDC